MLMGNTLGTLERNVLSLMRELWGPDLVGVIRTSAAGNVVQLFGKKVYVLDQGGLSDQDAVDVAESFSHPPRPDFPEKAKDWPKDKKPADARYPAGPLAHLPAGPARTRIWG